MSDDEYYYGLLKQIDRLLEIEDERGKLTEKQEERLAELRQECWRLERDDGR